MTKKEHINKILDLVDESRINISTVDFSLLRRLLEKEIPEQLILNSVSKRFFVVNELNSQDLEIISHEFTEIEDAKGFIETMKNGYTYKNSKLKVINVF